MSRSTNITFFTPPTANELDQYKDLVRFFLNFMPRRFVEEAKTPFNIEWAGSISLVFVGSIPFGMFYLDEFKNSVELHGIARPDAFWFYMPEDLTQPFKKRRLTGKRVANQLLATIVDTIFKTVFYEQGKDKIIVKVPKGSKQVLGFVRQHRFEALPNTDKGRRVYKLTKTRYEEFNN